MQNVTYAELEGNITGFKLHSVWLVPRKAILITDFRLGKVKVNLGMIRPAFKYGDSILLWIVQFLKNRMQNERFNTSINIAPTLLICLQLIGPLLSGMSFRTYCFLFFSSFFKVPGKYLKKILC